MSFREKSAWITLITLVVLTLFYITHLPPVWMLDPPGGWMFHVLAIGVGAFVVIEIVAHVIVAIRAPRDAQAPPSMLYGVGPHDPETIAVVAAVLAGVAGLACIVPAWRITNSDPMEALRRQ
jgi:ABC-type antimicrobial peptide transport system permease subunit